MKVGEGQDFTSHRHVGSRLRMRRIMLETSQQQLGKAFIGCHAADLHCNTLRWWRMANNPGAQNCYATFESMNWRSWDLEIFDILLYAVIAALLLFVIYEAMP
jgi:hypothetical protein